MPILNTLTNLKLASKSIGIVVLSEFGGTKKMHYPLE